MHSDRSHFLAVIELQAAVSDRAKTMRLLQDRVKYWREISGRRIDDLQHLGGRSLSVQRFLLLGQEPRVLDGDDGLVGEGFQKCNLTVSKWPHLEPIDENYSQQLARFEHGNREYGSKGLYQARPVSVFGVSLGIEHVDRALLKCGARSGAGPSGRNWILLDESLDFGGDVVGGHDTQVLTVEAENK